MSESVLTDGVTELLAQAGYRAPLGLERLAGGANNQVYRVLLPGEERLILKRYFRSPHDPRDRLGHEFGFLSLCLSVGIRSVPQPLAAASDLGMALYTEEPGRPIEPEEVSGARVAEAMAFVREVSRHRARPEAQALPPGSEACFTLEEHLIAVSRRLGRLANLDPADSLDRDARKFIQGPVQMAWETVRAGIERQVMAYPRLSAPLLPEERILSPSDFGFHNALVRPDGRLVFLDFEYAGWDDPAKLLGDFFCQPAKPAPLDRFAAAIESLAEVTSDPEWMAHRAQLLWPLYQLKWVAIVLNEFLPVGGDRRAFSGGEAVTLKRREAQLAKAHAALARALSVDPLKVLKPRSILDAMQPPQHSRRTTVTKATTRHPSVTWAEPERLRHHLEHEGYCVVRLSDDRLRRHLLDLAVVRVRERLAAAHPETQGAPLDPGLYHMVSERLGSDHSGMFPKAARVYEWDAISELFEAEIMRPLASALGPLEPLSPARMRTARNPDPEPEVYFRLVRPHRPEDAVHPHVDAWTHGPLGIEEANVKVWLPLLGCEPGAGFRLMPGSHRIPFKHETELLKTKDSPFNIQKLSPDQEYHLEEVPLAPNEILLFHRRVLHGGMLNLNEQTRYSAETTVLVMDASPYSWL